MSGNNAIHTVGNFKLFAEKPENAPELANILQQYNVKATPFQGTSHVSFDIPSYEIDHLSDDQVGQLADAVFFAGGRFQGVGTHRLNKISGDARKKCLADGIPLPT